jgi:signal transduction histidine kinase
MRRAQRAWRQRLLPQSLFGRLVAVLAVGLLVAQLLSAAINLAERESLLATSGGMQQAHRIADVVRLLDSLGPAERDRIVAVLNVPPLVLSLHDEPTAPEASAGSGAGPPARMYRTMLHALLGDEREVRVDTAPWTGPPAAARPGPGGLGPRHGPGMMGGGAMMDLHWGQGANVLRTQVQLLDRRWARFDSEAPSLPDELPWRLALTLAVLLVAVLALSYLAVRWVTRPLHVLATAADELGRDLHRPPLPETGPLEIRQAARAFNTMQARLARFIEDRTRILAAMSHDLKTPITRMRLRAELLDDDETRRRFEADLDEMQSMVRDTLDFMRGLGGGEAAQAIDVNALLESVQADQQAMGRDVQVGGRAQAPYVGVASLLRRCLANLIDNAVLYGGRARVEVDDGPACLAVRVCDEGPGIPERDLHNVFEPFYRLEASRNRATGGTGLGLTIARNIAHTHGGDISLRNHPQGGLEAVLMLPRASAGA